VVDSAFGAYPSEYNVGVNQAIQYEREAPLSSAVFAGALLVLVMLAAGFRLYGLGGEDYWLDELHSLMNSGGRFAASYEPPHGRIITAFEPMTRLPAASTLADVWRTCQRDAHPPLYFMLLHGWRRVCSDTETATRLLSVLFSVLLLVPLALMLRAMGRPRAGLLAALVMAVAFSAVLMGQQARPYGLGMFLVCASYWLFVELIERRAGARSTQILLVAAYAVCLLLCMLTHYFTALAVAPQVVWTLRQQAGRIRRFLVAAIGSAASVWLLVWGGAFRAQLPCIQSQTWLIEDGSAHGVHTLMRAMDLPARLLVRHELYSFSGFRCFLGLVLILLIGAAAYRSRGRGVGLLAAWCGVPLLFLLIVDAVAGRQTLAFIRYASAATPALAALIGIILIDIPNRLRWLVGAVCVLSFAAALRLPTPSNPHGRQAASVLAQHAGRDDLVVYDATDWPAHWATRQVTILSHYLSSPHPPLLLLRDPPSASLIDAIHRYRRVIVVAPPTRKDPLPLSWGFRQVYDSGCVDKIGTIGVFVRS